ncbi:hypothetical protein [Methanofollis tationis]|uniref:Uncharacterized protein n=1 Tax=Methanofollis tationis TaxID=81417 RepID=A0A7K4HPS6_9EURY|nr:hypothetical protein [Methanofollis tationis]NVO66848.1 hypothetical protein [Methanofollis tationis]
MLIILFLLLAPVAALRVTGAKWEGEVSPGVPAAHTIVVEPSPGEGEMDAVVEVLGFANAPDLSYVATGPCSACSSLSVSPTSLHLVPGERATVRATFTPPSSGCFYALISIRTLPAGEGAMGVVTAVQVPVMLTSPGAVAETARIDSVDLVTDGAPAVEIWVTHTGDRHFYGLSGAAEVRDAGGPVIWSGAVDPAAHALVPGSSVRLSIPVEAALPSGTCRVAARISGGDGTVLDERSVEVALDEGAAAFPEVSVDLDPSRASVLSSPDGRITLRIPAGAVFSRARLTLGPCSVDDIPAATAFAIAGIPGRLNAPMTIEVAYSPEDLASAGGDPGRLCLAYREDGAWVPVGTACDPARGVLTASSDRPGCWAVAVGGGGLPLVPVLGGIALLGGGYALLRRRR